MRSATPSTSILSVVQALGDERRLRMLWALGDGRSLPATRLAMEAGISPAAASSHLRKLVDGRLLEVVPPPPHHGRFRFYRLTGRTAVELWETIGAIAPQTATRSLQVGMPEAAVRSARTCYDHLFGRAGVTVMDALLDRGALTGQDAGFALTASGDAAFQRLDIDLNALRSRRCPLIRTCIDWTEQRPHLAGSLGNAMREAFVARGWLADSPITRAVTVTETGRQGPAAWMGVTLDAG